MPAEYTGTLMEIAWVGELARMLNHLLLVLFVSGLVSGASTSPVLQYSTYLRDNFTPRAIAADVSGNIYLAGNAIVDPAASQNMVLVVKLNPQATGYAYVRYIGGSVSDSANAIAVDAAGNAYVAGTTLSPDFPVTSGGSLGAPPGPSMQRSFVFKLDARGGLVFSDLVGGSAVSEAQAVAVNPAGQIVLSGAVSIAQGPPFPSTPGAYAIANTANHPYLLKLDSTGTQILFSATGIGGTALALDSSDNIYVAGSTYLLDYPTTPNAYQPAFPIFQICAAPPCARTFQGANQYVSKVNPTGSKLIYSTALSGTGNTSNGGLAVDAAGNAYVTGYAGPTYPYTVTPPEVPVGPVNSIFFFGLPFLSKLDAAGKSVLFSVPVGGSGVQVDSAGAVYVSGGTGFGFAGTFGIANNLPALVGVPSQCLPNNAGIHSAAYASKVDSGSGILLASRFIGGSALTTSGLALAGTTLWIAGATALPDFPLTPDALTVANFGPAPLAGAYLGGIDFAPAERGSAGPEVFCIVDSADMTPVGAVSRYQLLTMFGTGLGPEAGVAAGGDSTETLAGVSVNVGSVPAPLLYVSSTQINFAVPPVAEDASFAPMQLTVNGVTAFPRRLPLTFFSSPSLFPNTSKTVVPSLGPVALALNTDGSLNSAANPAPLGSMVSVFVNGLAPDPRVVHLPVQLSTNNGWSVAGIVPANPFVERVDLKVPSELVNNFACETSSVCAAVFTLYDLRSVAAGQVVSGAKAFGGVIYVGRTP